MQGEEGLSLHEYSSVVSHLANPGVAQNAVKSQSAAPSASFRSKCEKSCTSRRAATPNVSISMNTSGTHARYRRWLARCQHTFDKTVDLRRLFNDSQVIRVVEDGQAGMWDVGCEHFSVRDRGGVVIRTDDNDCGTGNLVKLRGQIDCSHRSADDLIVSKVHVRENLEYRLQLRRSLPRNPVVNQRLPWKSAIAAKPIRRAAAARWIHASRLPVRACACS